MAPKQTRAGRQALRGQGQLEGARKEGGRPNGRYADLEVPAFAQATVFSLDCPLAGQYGMALEVKGGERARGAREGAFSFASPILVCVYARVAGDECAS